MPDFSFKFANASDGTQEWNVQTIFEDTLEPGQEMTIQLDAREDLDIGVTVETVATPTRFAAGRLSYGSATAMWTFTTDTPKEFAFQYHPASRSCTLRCLLEVEQ